MGAAHSEMRIKGLTAERMERLKRFTRSLNAELALMGGEPLDLLEAHEEYQGLIDDHEGTWADLVRRIAAERTKVSYVEDGEEADETLAEFEREQDEP
jgi:hypothetical protein